MSACMVTVDGVERHKRRFLTARDANRAARRYNAVHGGKRKRGYPCPECDYYHIGGRA